MAAGKAPDNKLTLYSALTREPERIAPGEAERRILQGSHGLPTGINVNMKTPDGEFKIVPSSDVEDLVRDGWTFETPRERAINMAVEKSGSVSGQLRTAVEEFANQFALGVPEVVADNVQDPFDVEKRKAIQEANRVAQVIGGVGGAVASVIYGGPLWRGVTKGGQVVGQGVTKALSKGVAAEMVSQGVSREAAQAAAQSVAAPLAAQIAGKTAQFGTEGALTALPRALTEASFGDIDAAGESLLMGAGIGGVLGGAIGVSSPILRGLGKVYNSAISGLGKTISSGDDPIASLATKAEIERFDSTAERAVDPAAVERMMRGDTRLVANIDELSAAAKDLNVPLMDGMKTASNEAKRVEGFLSKSPTGVGAEIRDGYQQVWQGLENATDNVLGGTLRESQETIANQARERASAALRQAFGTLDDQFASVRRNLDSAIMSDEAALKLEQALQRRVGKIASEASLDASGALVKEMREKVSSILNRAGPDELIRPSASGIDAARREASDIARAAWRTGDTTRAKVFGDLADALNEATESTVLKYADDLKKNWKMPGAEAEGQRIIDDMAKAKADYAKFKESQELISKALGLGRTDGRGISKALEAIDTATDAKLVQKLASANVDAKTIRAMREAMPELYESWRLVQKQALLGKESAGKEISVDRFLSRMFKTDKAKLDLIFEPQEMAKIRQIVALRRAIPADVNPSGTAQTLEGIAALLKPVRFIWDAMTSEAVRGLNRQYIERSGVFAVNGLMSKSAQTVKAVSDSVSKFATGFDVESVTRVRFGSVLERVLAETRQPGAEEYRSNAERLEALQERLEDWVSNLDDAGERMADVYRPVIDLGAPQAGAAAIANSVRAVEYLKSQLPKTISPASAFDRSPPRVSDADLASFERKLHVVAHPEDLPSIIASGALTKEHVEAMRAVYPKMYDAMAFRAFNVLSDRKKHVDFQARLKLALLLNMPTHASLEPGQLQILSANSKSTQDMSDGAASTNVPSRLAAMAETDLQKLS